MNSKKQGSSDERPKIKTVQGKFKTFRGHIIPAGVAGNWFKTVHMCVSVSQCGNNHGIDMILGPSDIVNLPELRNHIDALKEDLDSIYAAAERKLNKLRD